MRKVILVFLSSIGVVYVLLCGLLFLFQEQIIFFPEKLKKEYKFVFNTEFEEVDVSTKDGANLNGLLFTTENANGLIFYLHGNAGSLRSWGEVAKTYTDLNYDVFILDYRGFGKSEGSISSQEQFYSDVQVAYNQMTKKYAEENIVVLGYSIGTGAAAKVASENNPKLLILQAPYFSLTDMMEETYPLVPTIFLKYKFETNRFVENCNAPIVIFHGTQDRVIYYGSSVKLKSLLKSNDRLVTLKGQGHGGITYNAEYQTEMKLLLN